MTESTTSRHAETATETEAETPIHVHLPARHLSALDYWIAQQPAPQPSRSEAIRLLLDPMLAGLGPSVAERTVDAAKLAGAVIDRQGDASASDEERAHRKRRLLNGPQEFRELRIDLPGSSE